MTYTSGYCGVSSLFFLQSGRIVPRYSDASSTVANLLPYHISAAPHDGYLCIGKRIEWLGPLAYCCCIIGSNSRCILGNKNIGHDAASAINRTSVGGVVNSTVVLLDTVLREELTVFVAFLQDPFHSSYRFL